MADTTTASIDQRLAQAIQPAMNAFLPMRRQPPMANGPYEICMLVISDVRSDPRVRREAETLALAGYRIKILYPDCYSPSFADKPIEWSENISFRPVPCQQGQYYATWPYVFGEGFHKAACEERPWAFHSHDLNTALIALSAAQNAGAYCVCDFHEWYSENVSWDAAGQCWGPHPEEKRDVYKLIERLVMQNANGVITVSDSIADAIRDELADGARRPWVIRNVPKLSYEGGDHGKYDLRKELGVGPEPFIVLWQGGIGPSRLLEPVIRAFAKTTNTIFAIRTPYWEAFGKPYEDLAAELGISDRIRKLDAVPSQDIVKSAAGADMGLWTLPNPCRNFYLALGNKIFEYLAAGLPILVANYPEAQKIIDDHGVGLSFDPYDPDSIAAAINSAQANRDALSIMRTNVPTAFAALDAGNEWDKLVTLYSNLQSHGIDGKQIKPIYKYTPEHAPPEPHTPPPVSPLTGYPTVVVQPNVRFSRPYLADRIGMHVEVRNSDYLSEQPFSFWWERTDGETGGPVLLGNRIVLEQGELLAIRDNRLFDFSVGTPMVAVRRVSDNLNGYITQDALITKTVATGGTWVAQDESKLRGLVEFPTQWGVLYSTNRVGPDERADTEKFLSRFVDGADSAEDDAVHPLACGAHAHRIGTWALAADRAPEDRERVAAALDAMMKNYLVPEKRQIAPGAFAWPYKFNFRMPWGTELKPPWYSGYANASLTGAAACAYALTGKQEYADIAGEAFGFLKTPVHAGGAHYSVDGFDFIAEYVYRSPAIPNLRVLDGEMCAIPYITNAGMLLDRPDMIEFAARLAAGQSALMSMLSTPEGAPYFCMDGQPMQPTYMWQLWMTLQLLASIFKDRGFAERARMWRPHIPRSFEADQYPF